MTKKKRARKLQRLQHNLSTLPVYLREAWEKNRLEIAHLDAAERDARRRVKVADSYHLTATLSVANALHNLVSRPIIALSPADVFAIAAAKVKREKRKERNISNG